MSTKLSIIVVEAGNIGLATAIALAQAGHTVQVLERRQQGETADTTGSGILLGPNSVKLLQRWKVDALWEVSDAHPVAHLRRYATGEILKVMKPRQEFVQRCINRAHLFDALYRTAVRAGVRVRFGAVVEALDPTIPCVKLRDGSTVSGDLIVGADGINSRIRPMMFSEINTAASLTSHVVFQASVPKAQMYSDPLTRKLYDDPTFQLYLGPDVFLIAATVTAKACYEMQAALYRHEHTHDPGKWVERFEGSEEICSRLRDWDAATRKVFGLADGGWKWRVGEVPKLPSWSTQNGRVVLVGDAAHATIPDSGHGTGQGLEDAAVLTELLCHLRRDSNDLPALMDRYHQLRRPRFDKVQQFAYFTGRGYSLPDGLEQQRRDRNLRRRAREVSKMDPTYVNLLGTLPFHVWVDTFDVVGEARTAAQQLLSADGQVSAKL